MNLFRRLSFGFWYVGRPPWDSGIVPPEVEEFIRTHAPARALDLGCGTGTSSLALARAGWTVTGVDFVPRAIKIAKQKAKKSSVEIDFRVGDVSRLHGVRGPFELALDIGCFHGLADPQKARYLDGLEALLAPGGIWLLYGFFKPDESPGPGFVPADLVRASRLLNLLKRHDGTDKRDRPSAWFWFQK
jgi:cyclopropane fatty-acyl-phospholipid synthase-like methyltransferase